MSSIADPRQERRETGVCEKSHLELISALEGQGAIVHVGWETFEESDRDVSVSERERFANESPRLVDSDLIRSLPAIVSVAKRGLSLPISRGGGEGGRANEDVPSARDRNHTVSQSCRVVRATKCPLILDYSRVSRS